MAKLTVEQCTSLSTLLSRLLDSIIDVGDDPDRWFPFTTTNTIGVMRAAEAASGLSKMGEASQASILHQIERSIGNLKGQLDVVLNKHPYLRDSADICGQILAIVSNDVN